MPGETDLSKLLKTLKPAHVPGDYVFCTVPSLASFNLNEVQCLCREDRGASASLSEKNMPTR
ncbi:MAG: ACT domain-containing protein [Bacteroidota bacterium]